jgi:hypothetical protein
MPIYLCPTILPNFLHDNHPSHPLRRWPQPATNGPQSEIGGCSALLHPTHPLIERWAGLRDAVLTTKLAPHYRVHATCSQRLLRVVCLDLIVVGSAAWPPPLPICSICPQNCLNVSCGLGDSCFHCIVHIILHSPSPQPPLSQRNHKKVGES